MKDNASFKDNHGNVYHHENKIFRAITFSGKESFEDLVANNIIEESIKNNFLIETSIIDDKNFLNLNYSYLVEHKKIPFLSYPYEWSFDQLKTAALHHLNFQIFLLEKNFTLKDASAFNIQFFANSPIFIDLLSIQLMKKDEYWLGHNQFCDEFLNPLLLTFFKKTPFNALYRGNLNGISTENLNNLLSLKDKTNFFVFLNIFLKSKLQKNYSEKNLINLKHRKFSKISYLYILKNFKNFIEKINLDKKKTTWSDYSLNNTYSSNQFNQKKNIIIEFVKKNSPKFLLDIGCNDGVYSELACKNGADYVVGIDSDYLSVNKAFQRSKKNKLNFLPLLVDFANPTPRLGWRQIERSSFIDRCNFDSIIALAVIHHLVIGKNLPLNEVIDVFMQISKNGIIEFVPKEDETVKYMLALREDIFFDYNIENFEKILATKAIIVNKHMLIDSKRVIFEYIRK